MKVLVADDDVVTRLWLESILQSWGYEVMLASNGDEAWHCLQQKDSPDLILLDWLMPGMDGVEVCRRVKAMPHNRFSYIIMLTSRSSTSDIVEALEAGADDLVGKPFEPEEMKVRLRVGERILSLQHQLLIKASHDELTGLMNRRVLMDMGQREFGNARRGTTNVSLLLLDVDHFKQVNDTYGHPAGDEVLREVARRLQDTLRVGDIVGRYGGEEFMILLPRCDLHIAKVVAERLRAAIAVPMQLGAHELPVTISIGVAELSVPTLDLGHWISRADQALYRAKGLGRNRVEIASDAGE